MVKASEKTPPASLPPKGAPLPQSPPNSIDYLGRGAPKPLDRPATAPERIRSLPA